MAHVKNIFKKKEDEIARGHFGLLCTESIGQEKHPGCFIYSRCQGDLGDYYIMEAKRTVSGTQGILCITSQYFHSP